VNKLARSSSGERSVIPSHSQSGCLNLIDGAAFLMPSNHSLKGRSVEGFHSSREEKSSVVIEDRMLDYLKHKETYWSVKGDQSSWFSSSVCARERERKIHSEFPEAVTEKWANSLLSTGLLFNCDRNPVWIIAGAV
jgi:hypothetical protein